MRPIDVGLRRKKTAFGKNQWNFVESLEIKQVLQLHGL